MKQLSLFNKYFTKNAGVKRRYYKIKNLNRPISTQNTYLVKLSGNTRLYDDPKLTLLLIYHLKIFLAFLFVRI